VNGGIRKGLVRAASVARTVERGKNPEDGTGGGLATSTLSAVVARPRRSEKGHPASLRSREQEPQERRFPGLDRPPGLRKQSRRNRSKGSQDAVRL